jgi:hypothetical protein
MPFLSLVEFIVYMLLIMFLMLFGVPKYLIIVWESWHLLGEKIRTKNITGFSIILYFPLSFIVFMSLHLQSSRVDTASQTKPGSLAHGSLLTSVV